MNVGVLALQGDFREHQAALERLGVATTAVRLPAHLAQVERLILPGGESSTIGKLLVSSGLREPLCARVREGMPVWGTCAGAIVLARAIRKGSVPGQQPLALMDIEVQRNGFGRQRDSFEVDLAIPCLGNAPMRGVFIRAPLIDAVDNGVDILARLPDPDPDDHTPGSIVAVQQGRRLATTFHPELTSDDRLHRYFLEL